MRAFPASSKPVVGFALVNEQPLPGLQFGRSGSFAPHRCRTVSGAGTLRGAKSR